ncbi:hypothetical protein PRUPE_2G030000 [Prunus persica]|uniref:Uncharacterized protein n=1 Tax=Prunus persica TaxID=3760 RepID=M5XPA1_PRUPE|nr:hypothetical protein PRUPE_2G030000 [Prunus persica]
MAFYHKTSLTFAKLSDCILKDIIVKSIQNYKIYIIGFLKLVFCLKEPNSCLARTHAIRISTEARQNKDWDFEIKGCFSDIGVKKELMASKDLYHVVVTPDMDQAFVIGVITILDYIYVESTRC